MAHSQENVSEWSDTLLPGDNSLNSEALELNVNSLTKLNVNSLTKLDLYLFITILQMNCLSIVRQRVMTAYLTSSPVNYQYNSSGG